MSSLVSFFPTFCFCFLSHASLCRITYTPRIASLNFQIHISSKQSLSVQLQRLRIKDESERAHAREIARARNGEPLVKQ